ncbi:MAG: transcription factor, partial [Nitrosopumilaceae archaeon]|nr:transcription factor [Nitrosopumilaceae archaeon]NDF36028.1 transcription factor [Nitrosopumilaceae archaeon]
ARALLKAEDATDEEIASSTGLRINMVRKVLYDLVENFIENQKKKINERLQQRLDYENSSQFYHCGNEDCPRITFENALEQFFKCPRCGGVVNLKKNDKLKKALETKITEIRNDMRRQL